MAQYLPQKPAAIPLIVALAAKSYFLHGNIGALATGVIPYLQDHSSPYEVVKGINWFIEKGKVFFLPASAANFNLFPAPFLKPSMNLYQ